MLSIAKARINTEANSCFRVSDKSIHDKIVCDLLQELRSTVILYCELLISALGKL